ncbi:hypothetical protein [Streptomyces sp. NPDC005799]|uniref:hypothetical protein n=1 Tax=Streptomyces sp. NPDC005799 TaxID=3154678 RepID=UPI0033F3BE5D
MRRLLAAVCTVLTVAALVTACSSGHAAAAHGRVTDKQYHPASSTWTWQPTTRRSCKTKTKRSGKKVRTTTSCRTVKTGRHRAVHHTAACWLLEIDHSATVCVSSTRWHHTHRGDRYQGAA